MNLFAGRTSSTGNSGARLQRIRTAGQLADRIGVFDVVQPTQHDAPRITGEGFCFHLQVAADPLLQSTAIGIGRLRSIFGWHLTAVEHLTHFLPDTGMLAHLGQ